MTAAASGTTPAARRPLARSGLVEAIAVVAVLGALVAYIAPTLDRPLLEKHAFRQTQTAYTARVFHEQGIDLLHPKLPVLGEPFEVPFEFPLFQALASLVMDAGVSDDTAMRTTGLACFVLTALLLFGLVRHVAGGIAALAALVAFTLSPFALVWSRSSMIEYLATAGAVGYCWATIRWRESGRSLPGGLALLAGVVGMLVKPTTAVFWVAPAFLYRPHRKAGPRRRQLQIGSAVLVAVPLLAALLWTRHADAIKAASPMTEWLTSRNLEEWNFGRLGQRFELRTWDVLGGRFPLLVGLGILLLPLAVLGAARSSQRLFWLGIASAVVLPPLVFTNLYVAHDYYLAAVSPAVAALLGLGFAWLWNRLPRTTLVRVSAIAACIALVYVSLELNRTYWLRIHGGDDDPVVLPLARQVEQHTAPGDRVAVVGFDWSPTFLYYANRWGLMVPPATEPVAFDLMKAQGYRYLLAGDSSDVDERITSRWRITKLSPHVYRLED